MTPNDALSALDAMRELVRLANDARERFGRAEDAGDIEGMADANAELCDVAVEFADAFPALDGYFRFFVSDREDWR